MTTIAVGTTQTTGYVASIDNSGNLVFQTNGTTTAMTLDTSQNANIVGRVTAASANINGNVVITGTANISSTLGVTGVLSTGNTTLAGTLTQTSNTGLVASFDTTHTSGGYLTWKTSNTAIADLGTTEQCFGDGSGANNFAINARGLRYLAFGTNNTRRGLISQNGDWMINTANNTAGGFANKLIVKQTSESWTGGIGVEAASNDHVLTIASNTTHHVISGSYRSLSGYRPLIIQNGGYPGITMDTSGRVQMPYQICVQAGASGATYDNGTTQQHWGKTGRVFQNQGNGWNESTGVFTSPIAATYLVKVSIRISSENYSASGNYNYMQLANSNGTVNGQPILLWSPASYTGGTYRPWVLTAIMKLNANDTITPRLYIQAGGQLVVDGGTTGQTDDSLSIIQIG